MTRLPLKKLLSVVNPYSGWLTQQADAQTEGAIYSPGAKFRSVFDDPVDHLGANPSVPRVPEDDKILTATGDSLDIEYKTIMLLRCVISYALKEMRDRAHLFPTKVVEDTAKAGIKLLQRRLYVTDITGIQAFFESPILAGSAGAGLLSQIVEGYEAYKHSGVQPWYASAEDCSALQTSHNPYAFGYPIPYDSESDAWSFGDPDNPIARYFYIPRYPNQYRTIGDVFWAMDLLFGSISGMRLVAYCDCTWFDSAGNSHTIYYCPGAKPGPFPPGKNHLPYTDIGDPEAVLPSSSESVGVAVYGVPEDLHIPVIGPKAGTTTVYGYGHSGQVSTGFLPYVPGACIWGFKTRVEDLFEAYDNLELVHELVVRSGLWTRNPLPGIEYFYDSDASAELVPGRSYRFAFSSSTSIIAWDYWGTGEITEIGGGIKK